MNKFVCLLLICWYTAMQAGEQGSLSCSLLRHESDDWVWSNMEVPEFTINLRNDSDSTLEARAKMIVVTDHGNAFITLETIDSITPKTSKDITFKLDGENKLAIAGFYRATFFVNDETVKSVAFGFDPTNISSPADRPGDFDLFWSAAKEQLFAVEANDIPLLTEIEEKSTASRKVYLVELKSIPDGNNGDPVTIRGFYCEPTDGNRHPVLIHYQGYDSFTGAAPELEFPSGDDRPDYCEFILSTRGQGINNRESYISDGGNPYGQNGWFSANFGNFDSYYYRGAYIDAVRAVDFMATRESSDMHNLFAEGASQGGAFTYVAAALSEYKFTAIAPSITFMSDFPDYLELAGWPTNEARARQKELGWSDDELLLFLSYFDTKNFASNISCPVITSVGVQDYICPPHTVMAPFNLLKTGMADKKVVFNAELQHSVNAKWTSDYLDFFDNYKSELKEKTSVISSLYNDNNRIDEVWFNISGQRVTNPAKGIYIHNGSKVLVK